MLMTNIKHFGGTRSYTDKDADALHAGHSRDDS